MTFDEIIQALEQVQHLCQSKPNCEGCPFDKKYSTNFITCRLISETPNLWSLDTIKMKKGEQNDK